MNHFLAKNDSELTLYCCMYSNCGSEYFSKYNLQRHVECVHKKLKRFQCSICSKLFASKQSLKEHYYFHSGFSPFLCVTCNKPFRQASLLSLHKRVHNYEGTISVIRRNFQGNSDLDFQQIEAKVEEKSLDLPKIEESRKGLRVLSLASGLN